MSEFYVIIARQNMCSRIYANVDRQYKRHYAAQKGSQDKQKLNKLAVRKLWKRTSNRFSHFRILYMFSHLHFADSISHFIRCPFSQFRTSHFIRAPWLTRVNVSACNFFCKMLFGKDYRIGTTLAAHLLIQVLFRYDSLAVVCRKNSRKYCPDFHGRCNLVLLLFDET